MNSRQIELLSTSKIKEIFARCNNLSPFIQEGDKEPAWDGFIYLYNNNPDNKQDNKTLKGRIPAQVKGKTCKKPITTPTYPIRLTNLENYNRDGGIAYFVVFIKDNEYYPYYALLAPIELRKYIKLGKGQEKVSIKLKPLNNIPSQDLEIEFQEFFDDCKRQTSFADKKMLSLEDAIKDGHKIKFSGYCKDKESAFEKFTNSSVFLYAEINQGNITCLYPIGDQKFNITPVEIIHQDISVNGIVFYNQYTKFIQKQNCKISIGNCLDIELSKDENELFTGKVSYNKQASKVSELITELKFIYFMANYQHIKIGENKLNINSKNGNEISKLRKELSYWERMQQLFTELHFNTDIDTINLSDKDFRNLELLAEAILDKREISQSHELNFITTMDIANFTILLIAQKKQNGKCIIEDYFNPTKKTLIAYKEDNKMLETSMFTGVFNREDFSSIANIDYSQLIPSYAEAYKSNPNLTDRANNDMLMALIAYDKQENKDIRILKAAKKISNWIIATNDKNHELNIINKFQILKRERELSKEEIRLLCSLISKQEIENSMKVAIYLLLDNQNMAEYHFDLLSTEEQHFFKSLPIYHFWKN